MQEKEVAVERRRCSSPAYQSLSVFAGADCISQHAAVDDPFDMFVKAFLILCAVAVCSTFRAEVRDPKSVKVSIYYESLCPASREFFLKQLWPHWKDLEEGINLDLIPYGRTNQTVIEDEEAVNGKRWEFECEHGPEECLANKLHACVIKKLHAHPFKMLKVIRCLMSKAEQQVEGLPDCLAEIHIKPDSEKFLRCMQSPEADALLAAYGERTQRNFKTLDTTPKIIFNDTKRKSDLAYSLLDFRKVVCARYLDDLCEKKNLKREINLQL